MVLPRHSQQTIYQRAINKVGKLRGLVEVVVNADGDTRFKSSFDGKEFENIDQAIGHIEATGINIYRVFGPRNQVGSTKGLDQIAEEARQLSTRLSSLTTQQQEVLQRLGLGDLAGKNIDITYQKFNYEGKAQKLAQIVRSDFVKKAGIVNITDEGVTALNYRVGKRVLSAEQAKDLKYVLGLGTLTDEFITKMFGSNGQPEFGAFAKLPKRIQGMLSERDISLVGDRIGQIFGVDPTSGMMDFSRGEVYQFDDVSAFFRAMFDRQTSQEERFLLTSGLGLSEQQVKTATLRNGSLEFRRALDKKFMELSGIDSSEMDRVKNLWSQAEFIYDSYSEEDKKRKGLIGAFKSRIEAASDAGTQQDKVLMSKIKASISGIERMRDGEFIGNVNLVNEFISELQSKRDGIVSSSAKLSPEDLKQISEIDSQLEALVHMKEAGQEGLDSAIARLQFPGMQGKGEIFLRKFGWMPKSLKNKLLIMPQSAFKTEVQGVPSILLNVAKTHAENIYSDPLMLLYHQDYFGTEDFMKGTAKNVEKQMQSIQSFMETGALPEDVRKEIFGAISSELKEDPKILPKMDSAARASYLRNRAEAKAIQDMLTAGVDPRQIPALVRRITDHFTKNAFRMKGERIDLAMPDAARLALRTYESSMEPGMGAELYQKAKIDLTSLGQEGQRYAAMAGSQTENLNFVQFRIQGNRMMLNGSAAHLYHHALGTFDLDDKGVPIMTTFKDANGNDRLAFMTMRQPTGFQEKIFMQGDLTDTSTLRAILQKSSGDFSGLLNDPDAIASLSDPKEQRVLDLMRKAINEKGNLDFKGLSSEDVEKVIVKLRKGFGEKHGFIELMQMTKGDLLEMAVSKSASALGMDKVIGAGINASNSMTAFQDFLAEQGYKSADAMPDYTRGNFINMITKEQQALSDARIVKAFNRRENKNFSTMEQINQYIDSLADGSVDKITANTRLASITQTVNENLQKASVSSVEDTLGLYINRQAAAVSMYQQVDDILDSLTQKGVGIGTDILADYYRANFSTAIIPPSPAVDVSKALISKMVIDEQKMREAAAAADAIRQSGGVSAEAVEKVISQFMQREVKLGEMGDIAVRQTGRGVGFLRAAQIAQGTYAADELIGFDAALFGEGPYARLRQQDMAKTVESVIQGAKEYLNKITDDTEKGRVQAFIDEMSASKVEEAISKITIQATSRYAVVGRYAQMATESKEMVDNLSSYAKRLSRTGVDPFEAVATAEYMSQTEAFIDSQRNNIEQVMRYAKASDISVQADILSDYYSQVVAGDLYRGLSAMAEADPTMDILDGFDTLEATIRTEFDQRTADRILSASTDIEGMESSLLEIRNRARQRRLNRRIIRSVSDEAYQGIADIAAREGYTGISTAEITTQEAADFVRKRIKMMADTGLSLEEIGESQDLFDFMKLRAEQATIIADSDSLSEGARNVFARVSAEEEEAAARNSSAMSDLLVSGADVGDDAKAIVADARAADEVTSVVRGNYTRIQDFIKNGSLRDLFSDPIIKRSSIAIAGLAAFGFIYSARKERTQEEASGPPLLPGGSAYETDYPRSLPSISDLKYLNPATLGIQYKINMNGSQADLEKMQTLAAGVVGAPMSSTMYDSLPRLGRDPYSDVASRF